MAGAVLLAVIATGLGIVVPRPFFVSPGDRPQSVVSDTGSMTGPRTVLLLSNAIHTDIALPASPDVIRRFGFLAADGLDPAQPGVDYIIVGWGGRSFYIETPTWADLRAAPVLRAFTLDRSVMHVAITGRIDPTDPSVMTLTLDRAAFDGVVEAVLDGFSGDRDAHRKLIAGSGYGAYDRFYEADGWFNAFAGCNTWTAAVLRRGGLKTGWWTPLPGLLTWSLSLHNGDDLVAYSPGER